MTSKEFVLWLKGFTDGVHEFNVSPKQWDLLKEKLAEVKDEEQTGTPIGTGWGTPNTAPIQTLPFIQPYTPYNPYKVTCEDNTTLTVTSGSGTTIIATPGYGSITYNPSTTTQMYPSGSAWSYTNNTYSPSVNRWAEHQANMANYKPYQPYTTGGEDEIVKHHNED